MDKLYTASVTATGGRNGKVVSDDGILNLDVKMPKALEWCRRRGNKSRTTICCWLCCLF